MVKHANEGQKLEGEINKQRQIVCCLHEINFQQKGITSLKGW